MAKVVKVTLLFFVLSIAASILIVNLSEEKEVTLSPDDVLQRVALRSDYEDKCKLLLSGLDDHPQSLSLHRNLLSIYHQMHRYDQMWIKGSLEKKGMPIPDYYTELSKNRNTTQRQLGTLLLAEYYLADDKALESWQILNEANLSPTPEHALSLLRTAYELQFSVQVDTIWFTQAKSKESTIAEALRLEYYYLIWEGQFQAATDLVKRPEYKPYINRELLSQVGWATGDVGTILRGIFSTPFSRVSRTGIIGAILIFGIWLFYVFRLGTFERIKWWQWVLPLLTGTLFTILCLIPYLFLHLELQVTQGQGPAQDLFYFIGGVGLIEEVFKLLPCVLLIVLMKRQFDTPFKCLLVALLTGLSFSITENLLYFEDSKEGLVIMRGVLTSIAHMSFCAIATYGLIIVRFKHRKRAPLQIIKWLLIAVVLHGLYDFFLGYGAIWWMSLFVWLISITVLTQILSNVLNQSPQFDVRKVPQLESAALSVGPGFFVILLATYWYFATQLDASTANEFLAEQGLEAGFIGFLLLFNLSNLNLVKGHWDGITPVNLPVTFKISGFKSQSIKFLKPLKGQNPDFPVEGEPLRKVTVDSHPDWLLVELNKAIRHEGNSYTFVLIKPKEDNERLSRFTEILVHFYFVPVEPAGDQHSFRSKTSLFPGWIWAIKTQKT